MLNRVCAGLMLSAILTTPTMAFELAGLRSGMSRSDVEAAAPRGFTFKALDTNGESGALINGTEVFATLAFCRGRLIAVTRMIDPDTDWLPAVQAGTRDRGPPQVSTKTQEWSGPGGGTVSSLVLRWRGGGADYDLSLTPEGRDGRGNLRHNRAASMSFFETATNPCWTPGRNR